MKSTRVAFPEAKKRSVQGNLEATQSPASVPEISANSSKLEVIKSTSIIGGATAITMGIRMVRTKVLAILLGPAGIGLESVFDSVLMLVRTLFDLGLGSAGVRQIAAANASGDSSRIATTVRTLRRSCLLLGTLGAAALFLAREPVSRMAFGDAEHAAAIGWLSLTLVLGAMAGGNGALLQGMRRIGDLARMNILGALGGAAAAIPIVLIWGQAGIPAYMIVGAALGLLCSWYFARRIEIKPVSVPLSAVATEVRGLFGLGMAFMLGALIEAATTFALRAIVSREFGVEGAGQFHAASALSLVYVGFILQAMGTDFYPRLTAVAHDNDQCNKTVDEQAEVSLLLALPGVLATIALAPWVIRIFYTADFDVAHQILVWQMCGILLRVMCWPMSYVIVAKGRGGVFIFTEVVAFSSYLLLAWLGMTVFGLPGAGMGFFGMYVIYVVIIYAVVNKLSRFRWNPAYLRYALVSLAAAAIVVSIRLRWPEPWATAVPCAIAAAAALHSARRLIDIVGVERIRSRFDRIRARVGG